MLVVTTPAQGAQKVAARVADMARRSYLKVLGVVENMTRVRRARRLAATRSSDRAAASASPRSPARRSSARCRSTPRCRKAATSGKPVVLAHPELPAARALTEVARRIVEELLPPVEMAGCTARMFDLVQKLAPASEPR